MSYKHFGQAGHFICADRCRFHLHTHVANGRWCVSTVGEFYANPSDAEPSELGYSGNGTALYETMVFPLGDDGETSDWTERDGKRYATRDAANAGHECFCDKWHRKPGPPAVEMIGEKL